MKTHIVGHTPPGRIFCTPDGTPLTNVHIAVQVRRDPVGAVSGDTEQARWEIDAEYTVLDDGTSEMFRRAKLMFDDIHRTLVTDRSEHEALEWSATERRDPLSRP